MSFPSGRARRPDDWPSSHVRAREDLSEQLDGVLDPAEAEWLETHRAACGTCSATATAYAAQRLELRALRDRTPEPPRDLWARTAAAIESEARFRDASRRGRGRRRGALAPFALLSSAVAVAVIVGTLTSSQRTGGDGTASPTQAVAVASDLGGSAPSVVPGATPLAVAQRVEWLSRDADGAYRFRVANVDEVCPPEAAEPCDTAAPVEDRQVALDRNLSSVFGSDHSDALIVFNNPDVGDPGTVNVVPLDASVGPSPSPTATPTATATASPSVVASSAPSRSPSPSTTSSPTATASPSSTPRPPATTRPASSSPSAPLESASPTPTASATIEPSPSVAVSPSPSTGTIEIARDVVLVSQSASYSPDGAWFAFTARPADGSLGPDIYVWKVGEALAAPVTSDHRSTFGSWAGATIVGSTVLETTLGGETATTELTPQSFLIDPLTQETTDLPAAGRAWRPAVDPSGRKAVYWAGTLRATVAPGFAPDAGRLVLGTWTPDETAVDTGSQSPPASAIADRQARAHDEVTIAAGRMEDWEARWDLSGTHLAVWIADAQDPRIGRLSLYGVSGFDGRIDLRKPLLDAELATAGFAISEGKLVWATPSADGAVTGDRIQVLAWTENGQGQVESVSGPVVVIR